MINAAKRHSVVGGVLIVGLCTVLGALVIGGIADWYYHELTGMPYRVGAVTGFLLGLLIRPS